MDGADFSLTPFPRKITYKHLFTLNSWVKNAGPSSTTILLINKVLFSFYAFELFAVQVLVVVVMEMLLWAEMKIVEGHSIQRLPMP